MKFELEEYHRNVSEEELIQDLKRVALKLKKDSITHKEYNRHGRFHSCTLGRKFGSWFKALEKAGLKKTRNYGVTDEEYFVNLEEVWVKLGRQPHYREIRKPFSKYSGHGYWHRFGSWRKALERFIEYVNKEEIPIINKSDLLQKTPNKHKTTRNISWRLRFIIMKRDNFKCKICGRSPATDSKVVLHVDHIIAYSNGGETVPENLQTLCSICNIGKSNL